MLGKEYAGYYQRADEMMQKNAPMWQTSQQQWAKDARDANAARLYDEARRNPSGRMTAMAEARDQIARQGGGMGLASNIGAGPGPTEDDWKYVDAGLKAEAAFNKLKRETEIAGLRDQMADYEMKAEQRAASRDMLKNARNMMGGGIGGGVGGSYRV